jgi:hypothetical protein
MGSDDVLRSVSADTLVPLLVNLLAAEHNPDIMLLASRTLYAAGARSAPKRALLAGACLVQRAACRTHLIDWMPSWSAAVVQHNAIPQVHLCECVCERACVRPSSLLTYVSVYAHV